MAEVTCEVTSETATIWVDVTQAHSWTWAELNNTNLQVRIACQQGNDASGFTMYLDVIYVRVTYTAACEAYATEAILDYNLASAAEAYAAEAILNYEPPPCEVYAAEAILDYALPPPCEVYAAEAILVYIAPAEVYAAETILNYEYPPCEAYAAEAILDYTVTEASPCEIYAVEGILDYNEFQPCEAYAAEAILDYEPPPADPCEVYAAEVVLNYMLPGDEGWWGWYRFQFVVHPIRRFRTFVLFGGKQNLDGELNEEKVREK
jgi:hypothetical protein